MGSRGYFRLIAVLLIVVVAASIGFALMMADEGTGSWIYVAAQVLLIAAVVLLVILYQKTIKPLNTLSGGIDLIKEQDFSTRLRPVGQKDADRIIELFNRMSDRLHNEELRIQEQNHFLDQLIAASPAGVLIMNIGHRIDSSNPALDRMLGIRSIEPYRGQSLQDSPLPLLRLLAGLQPDEGRILQTDPLHIYRCTLSSFMDRGFPHPFYMVEPLTEELYEAEKRGYKKVIRVISHEVNNTMAGITSALYAIQQTSTDSGDGDTAAMLSILLSRIDRMSRFITDYASMARIPDPVCRPVDACAFLRRVLPFLESLRGQKQIAFVTEIDEKAGEVPIDQVLMEQVLTNIVKNAVEAFPDGSPDARITVTARPGYWCVADNGAPIPEETALHLFTPFFSTKPDGKGIGLIVIHEILTRSGIRFSLGTGEDGITRFELFFQTTQ